MSNRRRQEPRALRLNTVIAERDGEPVTMRQAILRYLESGYPFDTSISLVGTDRGTVNNWLKLAARARERITIDPHARLTPQDRDLIVFARQIDEAIANAERKHWDLMGQLAAGGLTKRRVVIKHETIDGRPVEVERTTMAEDVLPSFAANRWILEERYGRRKPLDVRVDDGELTDAEAARHLGDAMERWLSTHDADAPPASQATNGHAGNGHA